MRLDKIAVLIPCYNESKTIEKVIQDFQGVLPDASIYVYDNNSTDDTRDIAERTGAITRMEGKKGKGNVIRRMFSEIDAEVYILVDGDDTYPVNIAPEMIDAVIRGQADMVVGDRMSSTYLKENKRIFHNFGNLFVRWSINTLFSSDVKDVMTGYRAFSYRFVKTFPLLSRGFEIETEMSIHAIDKNMSISHVKVMYQDRKEGSFSKLNTFKDGVKVLLTIIKLFRTYRPLRFFGFFSIVLMLLSLVFFVPVFVEYTKTGMVERFPTLIVCGFAAIASSQSFFAGLMLQTIYQKNRQDFEMYLYDVTFRYKMLRDKT